MFPDLQKWSRFMDFWDLRFFLHLKKPGLKFILRFTCFTYEFLAKSVTRPLLAQQNLLLLTQICIFQVCYFYYFYAGERMNEATTHDNGQYHDTVNRSDTSANQISHSRPSAVSRTSVPLPLTPYELLRSTPPHHIHNYWALNVN